MEIIIEFRNNKTSWDCNCFVIDWFVWPRITDNQLDACWLLNSIVANFAESFFNKDFLRKTTLKVFESSPLFEVDCNIKSKWFLGAKFGHNIRIKKSQIIDTNPLKPKGSMNNDNNFIIYKFNYNVMY